MLMVLPLNFEYAAESNHSWLFRLCHWASFVMYRMTRSPAPCAALISSPRKSRCVLQLPGMLDFHGRA